MNKTLYVPGDKWLYYNLYCGVNTQDELIKTVIFPLAITLLKNNFIVKWFFIRYSDPDLHLRLRFEITSYNNIGLIMQEMNSKLQPFVKSHKIWRINLDSYKPENFRYHHSSINIAEEFFFQDSHVTAIFLSKFDGDKWEDIRWKFALLSVDVLLSDFEYSLEEKRDFCKSMRDAYAKEFQISKDNKILLDKKYRRLQKEIDTLFESKASRDNFMIKLLHEKSKKIATIRDELLDKQKDFSDLNIDNILRSYIHMMINRIFRTRQRFHEFVLYDFLYRRNRSQVARLKQFSKNVK